MSLKTQLSVFIEGIPSSQLKNQNTSLRKVEVSDAWYKEGGGNKNFLKESKRKMVNGDKS